MEKGSRKLKESRETALSILLGFVVAAYFNVSAELFGMLVLGMAGKSAGFMWGNAKEHQNAAKPADVPPQQ